VSEPETAQTPRGHGTASSRRPPRVAVVIPTRDRPLLLARCLAALRAQTLDPADFEIIVAADAPAAPTRETVEEAGAPNGPPVRYVPVVGRHGPAAARNAGWRLAVAPTIAFTDDDCIPEPGWLAAGLAALHEGVVGVRGRVVVPRPATPSDYQRTVGWLEQAEFVTANCFCRRAALAAVGGFDERFTAAWREDSDLYFTLLERGNRFGDAPGAVVVHPARPAPWGVSLREQRKSRFNALLFRKHPRLYRQRIQARPPWRYYGIVASLVAATALAARGHRVGSAAAGTAWLLLTAAFCRHRLQDTARTPGHVAEMLVTSAGIPPLAVFWRLAGALRYGAWFL
jgi:glycosyltransferase involved in cell wall biosynthesis